MDSGLRPSAASEAECYDLTQTMMPYWDPHMTLEAMVWLRQHNIYSREVLDVSLKALLERYPLTSAYERLEFPVSSELQNSRAAIEKTHSSMEKSCASFVSCLVQFHEEHLASLEQQKQQMQHYQSGSSGTSTSLEKKSVTEWNRLWQERKSGLISEMESLLKECESGTEKEKMIREEYAERLECFHEFGVKTLDDWFKYSNAFYQEGNYQSMHQRIRFYLTLATDMCIEPSLDRKQYYSFSWGLLLSALMQLPDPKLLLEAANNPEETPKTLTRFELPNFDPTIIPVQILKLDEETSLDSRNTKTQAATTLRGGQQASTAATPPTASMLMLPSTLDEFPLPPESVQRLTQLSWLLHWAVWALFKYYFPRVCVFGTRASFIKHHSWLHLLDWMLSEKCISVVHLVCPHLLRYYVACVTLRKRTDQIKTVVNAVVNAQHKYNDPLTRLVSCLYDKCTFDQGQQEIASISAMCNQDLLLAPLSREVEESSRLLIFDTYCRIHQSIDVTAIAEKLNMTEDVAERWIVNLIRDAKLDAKIDSNKNVIEVANSNLNVPAHILERTRVLLARSQVIARALGV